MSEEGDPLEIVRRLKFDYKEKQEFFQEKGNHTIFLDSKTKTNHSVTGKRPDLGLNDKKKTLSSVTVPIDHKVTVKEDYKLDKYVDIAT